MPAPQRLVHSTARVKAGTGSTRAWGWGLQPPNCCLPAPQGAAHSPLPCSTAAQQPEQYRRAQQQPVLCSSCPTAPLPQRSQQWQSCKPRARGDFRLPRRQGTSTAAGSKAGMAGTAEQGPLLFPQPLQHLTLSQPHGEPTEAPGAGGAIPVGSQPTEGPCSHWGWRGEGGPRQLPEWGQLRGGPGQAAAAPACVGSAMCLGSLNTRLPFLPSAPACYFWH